MIALRVLGAVILIGLVSWLADNFYGGTADELPENDERVRERMLDFQRENDSTAA